MENDFFKRIDNSNASTNRRNELHHFVIQNPEYLKELCAIALNTHYKNHYKGVWILEMIAEKQTITINVLDHETPDTIITSVR